MYRSWNKDSHPEEWATATLVHAASTFAHRATGAEPPWHYDPVSPEALTDLGITPDLEQPARELVQRTTPSTAPTADLAG